MTMNKLNKFKQDLLDAVEITIKSILEKPCFDVTKQGRITVIEGNGLYTVAINGQEYPNIICGYDIALAVNDAVWVTVPQGVWMHKFIAGRR